MGAAGALFEQTTGLGSALIQGARVGLGLTGINPGAAAAVAGEALELGVLL
jgi:hypothetical protein